MIKNTYEANRHTNTANKQIQGNSNVSRLNKQKPFNSTHKNTQLLKIDQQ